MRLIRLALGVIILVQGIVAKDLFSLALGGFLSLMPLLNIGCCGVSGCSVTVPKRSQKAEEATYEEVR